MLILKLCLKCQSFRVQEANGTVRAATQLIVSQIKTENGTIGQEERFGTPAQLVFVTEEVKGVHVKTVLNVHKRIRYL